MKRINIYITEETDRDIDNLSEIFSESRSEIIRKAISEYSHRHQSALDEFVSGLDEFNSDANQEKEDWIKTELKKCQDIEYFLANYIKINTSDNGVVQFEAYKHQMALAQVYSMYNKVVVNQCRQAGITVLTCAFIIHYALFNENKLTAILSPKEASARNTLYQIKEMLINLPDFIKEHFGITEPQKMKVWNTRYIQFDNGSRIMTCAASASATRGHSVDLLYLDQFAYVPKYMADEFIAAIFPTVTSSNDSKIFITSSPNGPNHFYKIWTDSISDYLDFHPIKIDYRLLTQEHQDRLPEIKKAIGPLAFRQEYECEFNVSYRGGLHVV